VKPSWASRAPASSLRARGMDRRRPAATHEAATWCRLLELRATCAASLGRGRSMINVSSLPFSPFFLAHNSIGTKQKHLGQKADTRTKTTLGLAVIVDLIIVVVDFLRYICIFVLFKILI
jgi:hypothetical protein